MAKRDKRGIHLTDTHGGNICGLLPPPWQTGAHGKVPPQFWDWFAHEAGGLEPVDFVNHYGDAVDGEGKKGTVGIAYTDVGVQAEIAAHVIRSVPLRSGGTRRMCRGTPFHTDGATSYETAVAKDLGCEIADELYFSVNGVRHMGRHVISRAGTPYTQAGMLQKEMLRDFLEAIQDGEMEADVYLWGHAHTSCRVDVPVFRPNGKGFHMATGVALPGLELPRGTPYARTQRPFNYHVGFLEEVVSADGDVHFIPHLCPLKFARRREYVEV